jgi:L-amino acid N-acyltransferase YncA/RimJ/RimL family protein N-acetyltransferase
MIGVRVAEDDELEAYVAVWNAITPAEPSDPDQQRERRARDPRRLYLVAELDGGVVGCGFAGPSQSEGRGFLSPRVLPEARRRGVGVALLRELSRHLTALDFVTASSHVDGGDAGSLAFGRRFGFEEVDRQVEQVRTVGAAETAGVVPDGVTVTTLAVRPELLRESYALATEGYEDMATFAPVSVTLDDWLSGDDANVPEGSFVALAGNEVVGFSGLCRNAEGGYEDGLSVVGRGWRRRGLAEALKREKLAWAAANGVQEIGTWTQRGNEGMRALNERLGYVYRSVSITVRADLPVG